MNIKDQCQSYEEDLKKLKEENQSLETVRKIKEKDAENEKAVLEAVVSLKSLATFFFRYRDLLTGGLRIRLSFVRAC